MWALKILHERNWRVESLCSGTIHEIFSLNSCNLSGISEVALLSWQPQRVSPFSQVSFQFVFGIVGWLGELFVIGSRQTTGFPVLSSTLKLDTGTGSDSIPILSFSSLTVTNLRMMWNNASPVSKVSLKLKDENRKKNSLTSMEPQKERSC